MLIKFRVHNFLSFKDWTELNLEPFSIKEHEETNIGISPSGLRVLKSAVIFGANSSGKSNLLKAIIFMKRFILNSSKDSHANDLIDVDSFKLNPISESQPSTFEITFLYEGLKYRYGFTVDQHFVYSEWLHYTKVNKEYKYFLRERDNFDIEEKFSEAAGLDRKTRPNALFLSVVAQFNGPISTSIMKWIDELKYITDTNKQFHQNYTAKLFEKPDFRNLITKYLKRADLGFSELLMERMNIPDLSQYPIEIRDHILAQVKSEPLIMTQHLQYDEDGQVVGKVFFNLNKNESLGTQKYFAMAGLIVETLAYGKVLVVDELDARLHPLLSHSIVRLFNSRVNNPNNAQLIFATHDTNMLSKKIFRRDQIFLARKDKYGATTLTTLARERVRNDESYEKNYLQGEYEAIPNISNQLSLFNDFVGE